MMTHLNFVSRWLWQINALPLQYIRATMLSQSNRTYFHFSILIV
jgi:hypothetical protein